MEVGLDECAPTNAKSFTNQNRKNLRFQVHKSRLLVFINRTKIPNNTAHALKRSKDSWKEPTASVAGLFTL
jgi:hypothetical protein